MNSSKFETSLESTSAPVAGKRGTTTLQVLVGIVFVVCVVPVFATLHPSTQSAADSASSDQRSTALKNIKQITAAMIMYANDFDGTFPYAQQTLSAMAITSPYVKDTKSYQSPTKGGKFLYNLNVGGVLMTDIPEPALSVLWFEKLPNPKLKNAVGFVDGHAKLINENERVAVNKSVALKFKRVKGSNPLPINEGLGKNSTYLWRFPEVGATPPPK